MPGVRRAARRPRRSVLALRAEAGGAAGGLTLVGRLGPGRVGRLRMRRPARLGAR
ncbi:hypothetical protein MICRO8M_70153 [Microbacterium sp. 8M]|nr:hypothetical protein MICRO8M_70153 [Microbacterium sp. 8M]